MRYMFLIYSHEGAPTPEEAEAVFRGHRAVMEEATKRSVLRACDPLKPSNTATTVRMRNGEALTTDGPFAETKEQLAGYYILDCKDLDEAIDWARKIPSGCNGKDGCVEIRPIREIPTKP